MVNAGHVCGSRGSGIVSASSSLFVPLLNLPHDENSISRFLAMHEVKLHVIN